ncbi:DNA polymerase III subunit epsilon [Elioraea sp. Yellowstone]|jgi:DNA polymerase-3 subunit epsilon|uniref:DNA polymerase III subunit epsilon n=1 Tax=Elioraea sp. Yellowstone TaxID=2592070 RepID=UPI0011526D7E|nr:DNA polymerase III subunit epsilon [Elioraea sp. Yellowstone]TQF83770.1 DNA polymerase III subunit epsilon [Elioraea sp. Yellowstone]
MSDREVLLDTETTGLEAAQGHRIIEICCLELRNHVPTGRVLHRLVDPGREIDPEAERIHGITRASLIGKPAFGEIADELLAFLGEDPIVAHNAPFDIGFINAELARLDLPPIDPARAIDTVALARRRHPGLPANLDALCRRFGIDISMRTTHNALLDCQLLAQVYLELLGGRQPGLGLAPAARGAVRGARAAAPPTRRPRPIVPSAEELAAHRAFIASIEGALWARLEPETYGSATTPR